MIVWSKKLLLRIDYNQPSNFAVGVLPSCRTALKMCALSTLNFTATSPKNEDPLCPFQTLIRGLIIMQVIVMKSNGNMKYMDNILDSTNQGHIVVKNVPQFAHFLVNNAIHI